jgi:hypothetical protein
VGAVLDHLLDLDPQPDIRVVDYTQLELGPHGDVADLLDDDDDGYASQFVREAIYNAKEISR